MIVFNELIMNIAKEHKRWLYIAYCLFGFFYSYETLSVLNPGHDWGGDFALYISQAQAIVEGGTETLFEASKASCQGSYMRMNPDVYPVGYPLMLAPIYKYFGMNFIAFKLLTLICFLILMLTLVFYFIEALGYVEAIIILGLVATSNYFIKFSNNILADIPSMMFVWLGIFFFSRLKESDVKKIIIKYSILSAILVCAYQTKTLSISVAGAFILHDFIRYFQRKIGFKILFLKMFVFLSIFLSINVLIHLNYPSSSSGYLAQLLPINPKSILDNISYYTDSLNWFLYNSNFFIFLTTPFMFWGMYLSINRNLVLTLITLLHFILLLIWPFQQGLRFIFLLIPIYFYFFCLGSSFFFEAFAEKYKTAKIINFRYSVLWVLLFFSIFNTLNQAHSGNLTPNDIQSNGSIELFDFIKSNTKQTDKFIFFKPNVLRLICQRESVYLLDSKKIKDMHSAYWIHNKNEHLSDTSGLKMVFNNANFIVFLIK